MYRKALVLLLALFLVGCDQSAPESNIYKVKVGETHLCINKAYFPTGDDPSTDTILLSMMRPEMRPITRRDYKEMGTDDYWKHKTSLLLNKKWQGLAQQPFEMRQKNYTETREKKYNLIVTQNNTKAKSWQFYLEPGHRLSDPKAHFIRCLAEGSKNPQCSHLFNHDRLFFQISYSMRNLPNWKDIKEQVIKFIEDSVCE